MSDRSHHQPPAWQAPVELEPDREGAGPGEVPPEDDQDDAGSGDEHGFDGLSLRQWSWTLPTFLGGIAALILVTLAFDASDLLSRAFAAGDVLGIAVAALVALVVLTALKLALDELVAVRRLRRIDRFRIEAERLVAGGGHGAAGSFAERLSRFYRDRTDLAPGIEALHASVTDAHNDREIITLIDRQVLAPIDQSAYNAVLRASRDTALATALSPSAALDVVIVLWRNLKLVREVASAYGARPGQFGSWRLMRRMLANLAVAGVAEGLSHVAVDALGGSIAAAISTKLGQGMVNGLLTARIGVASMVLCRPIAFSADNRPTLRRIRSELLSVPKQIL
ncbi:MAG: TIGR01620 family protein [Rhodospirillaceae bacterium]